MAKKERIAIGGSAANPPHVGHFALLKALRESNFFDKIIWVLSGTREGKDLTVGADNRVAMTELLIPDKWRLCHFPKLIISYQDVYDKNTPTIVWLERLKNQYPLADIVWYTGVDSVVPQAKYQNLCEIEATWIRGQELMRQWSFLVIPRAGFIQPELFKAQLPDFFKFQILDVQLPNVASSEIRRELANGVSPYELWQRGWLTEKVSRYIESYELYKQ